MAPVGVLVAMLAGLVVGATAGYGTYAAMHEWLGASADDFWHKLVLFIVSFAVGAMAAVLGTNTVAMLLMRRGKRQ